MPILIYLKEPTWQVFAEGELKMEDHEEWDRIFNNACLIMKNDEGKVMLIPTDKESNIFLMKNITKNEVKEIKERAEKARKLAEAKAEMGGQNIIRPHLAFPKGGNQ